MMMDINKLSSRIIAAAIEVHKALGPGLLEFQCAPYENGIVKIVNELEK